MGPNIYVVIITACMKLNPTICEDTQVAMYESQPTMYQCAHEPMEEVIHFFEKKPYYFLKSLYCGKRRISL